MKDKNQIIEEVYKSGLVEKIANSLFNIVGTTFKDDFIQEMYINILTMPEDRLQRLYEDKQLNYYIVKIIKNQAFNKKSVFNIQIKNSRIPTTQLDKIIYENL